MQSYFGRMISTEFPRTSSSLPSPKTTSPNPPTFAAGAHSGAMTTMYMDKRPRPENAAFPVPAHDLNPPPGKEQDRPGNQPFLTAGPAVLVLSPPARRCSSVGQSGCFVNSRSPVQIWSSAPGFHPAGFGPQYPHEIAFHSYPFVCGPDWLHSHSRLVPVRHRPGAGDRGLQV